MYLEAHWEMYEVKIQILQLQISERLIETDGDVLRSVMSPPQLFRESLTTEHSSLPRMYVRHVFYVCSNYLMSASRQFSHRYKSVVNDKKMSPVCGPHLADNEHVLAFDDTLVHLGFQRLANISFILKAVSRVNVATTSSDGCLYRPLDRGVGEGRGLQQ